MANTNTAHGPDLPVASLSPQAQELPSTGKWREWEYQSRAKDTETELDEALAATRYEPVASDAYDLRLYMALGGAVLLAVGTFLPLFTLSDGFESESINYFGTGGVGGWLILAFAGIAASQAVARRYKGPVFVGVAALALMISNLISVTARASEVTDLGVSLDLSWAWLALVPGSILLIWSRWAPRTDRRY